MDSCKEAFNEIIEAKVSMISDLTWIIIVKKSIINLKSVSATSTS